MPGTPGRAELDPVLAAVEESDVEPVESLVVAADEELTIWRAIRWVFRVPTNFKLIMASALGYFFLSGLRTFALIYARGRFGIGQGLATLLFLLIGAAAVAGVLVSGRWTDRLIHRGHVDARLVVGGLGFLVAAALFVPALLTGSVLVSLPLFLLAAFALSAPNPPVDAARLDVVPSGMWGRAESIRTTVRIVLEALAPLTFGLLSIGSAAPPPGGWARASTKTTHRCRPLAQPDSSTPSSSCWWPSLAPGCCSSGPGTATSGTLPPRPPRNDQPVPEGQRDPERTSRRDPQGRPVP